MAEFKPRAAERRRCYLMARFVFDGGYASLDAVARNISPLGARIEADDLSIVPSEFDLLIGSFSGDDSRRRARRVWRHDGAMGVAFIAGAEPMPIRVEAADQHY
jgi:hypothetical protein